MADFQRSVKALVEALIAGRDPTREDLITAQQGLTGWVSATFPNLPDAEDVVDESFVQFFVAVRRGRVTTPPDASPYLVEIAKNGARDQLNLIRRAQAVAEELTREESEDPLGRVIEAVAGQARVERAMRRLVLLGDHDTVRIVATWLDQSDRAGRGEGREPSYRSVAADTGFSHQKVKTAIDRFGDFLTDEAAPEYME